MKMIALKDFYDQYGGKEVKAGEIFNVLDSRKDEMLSIKVNGENACKIFDENDLPKIKKNIVIKRVDAVRYLSLLFTIFYIVFACINKVKISEIIFNLSIMFFLYNIFMILNLCLEILRLINKNTKK